MTSYVIDCEGDGLSPTKIHCLAWKSVKGGEVQVTTNYDKMREILLSAKLLVGHNLIRFDIVVLERILGIKITAHLIDTLATAWYLEPSRSASYGLDAYGEQYGIPKPLIVDWHNLTPEEYSNRCVEDVKINWRLWDEQRSKFRKIYGTDEAAFGFLQYLAFKMDCAREQERSRWKLDVELAEKTLAELEALREEKITELAKAMPRPEIIAVRRQPKVMFKADGELSAHAKKWYDLLDYKGLPHDYDGEVPVVLGTEDPNPKSHVQIKNWVKSLGWQPQTFKYDRDKSTGQVRAIPQIRNDKTGELCDSVKALFEKEPALEVLGGLSVLNHRIPMLNGFLNNVDPDGFIKACVQGVTNTLRFRHSVVVNLPKVDRPYGDKIRGCLSVIPGFILCGSDMTSLEDRIKHHFLYKYDPKYVKEMSRDDYDPHIALAVMAGMMTAAEGAFYTETDKRLDRKEEVSVEDKKEYGRLKSIRSIAKNGNYACQYGAGPARIALTANISLEQAQIVHEGYWKLNWAIKKVAEEQKVKVVDGQKWLFNPISKFWYSLREEKDRFSTLVQGTAAYVFDEWVREIRKKRPQLTAQFHDEIVLSIRDGYQEAAERLILEAIQTLNGRLKLNRQLDVKVEFGQRYSDIH